MYIYTYTLLTDITLLCDCIVIYTSGDEAGSVSVSTEGVCQ